MYLYYIYLELENDQLDLINLRFIVLNLDWKIINLIELVIDHSLYLEMKKDTLVRMDVLFIFLI